MSIRNAKWLGFPPWLFFSMLVLLVVSFFVNLGIYPLYLEEPRRALIALEMIFRGNPTVPTEMGLPYFKKPPLFNWFLIANFELFGNYSEWAVRTGSVITLLLTGSINYLFVRKYLDQRIAILSSLLFLVSVDIYYYFSLTAGEIDLFYTLLTYSSFLALYHFYRQQNYWLLFLSVYLLNALGFLTKGLPSILFIGLSLVAFFIFFRQFKKLFTVQHISGILLFLAIVGGYFFWYSQYNSPEGFVRDLWSQSNDRTPMEMGVISMFRHLVTFPLNLLKILLPASLLLLAGLNRNVWRQAWSNEVVRFFIVLFLANIWIYWLSPGTRTRYLYMLLPLAINVIVFVYWQRRGQVRWFQTGLFGLAIVSLVAVLGICAYTPYSELAEHINQHLRIVIWLLGAITIVITLVAFRYRSYPVFWIVVALIFGRLWFDMSILPTRAAEGELVTLKQHANEIIDIAKDEELFIYKYQTDGTMSLQVVFYVERARKEVLEQEHIGFCGPIYIAKMDELGEREYQRFHQYEWNYSTYYVVRFTDCQTAHLP